MAWDFETEPEFEEQLEWMRAFIDSELIPLEPICDELPPDEWSVVKRHLQDQVKARGLWGAFLDPELGGPGFGQLKLALMSEIIGRCMMSMRIFGVQAPDSGNMELLAHGATDAQKERWLWPNLRGEISSAFALTEPFLAGADPTVHRHDRGQGRRRVGDQRAQVVHHQRLGRRHHPGVRRDQPRGPPAPARLDVRSCPTGTPGMEIVRDIGTMAHPDVEYGRPGNHAEIIFRDCRVPADHLIGEPGDGFVLAQQRLGGGRIHHAMRWLGQAQRSLDIMCERAVSRQSHGKLLGQHQMIQDYIALSHTEIQAARLLTFQTAWKMDKYGAAAVRADLGMIKAHVSKVVLGRARPHHPGLRRARLLRATCRSSRGTASTRFGPIGDGPDELHKSVLARTLLKGYKPVEGWPTEHIPSRRPAAEAKWQALRARGRGSDRAARAVFFDFAGTLFSRSLRTVHLEQLRFVGAVAGATASDDELRAAYRQGMGVAYRTVATRRTTSTASCSARRSQRRHGPSAARWNPRGSPPRSTASTGPRSTPPSCGTTASPRCGYSEHRVCASRSSRTSTTSRSRRSYAGSGSSTRSTGGQARSGRGRASRTPASTRSRWRARGATRRGAVRGRQCRPRRRRATGAGHGDRVARRRRATGRNPDGSPDFVIERLGQVVEIVERESVG